MRNVSELRECRAEWQSVLLATRNATPAEFEAALPPWLQGTGVSQAAEIERIEGYIWSLDLEIMEPDGDELDD
jgi:hypothetical protein